MVAGETDAQLSSTVRLFEVGVGHDPKCKTQESTDTERSQPLVGSYHICSLVLLDGAVRGHVGDDHHGKVVRRSPEVLQHALLGVRHVYVEHLAALLLRHLCNENSNQTTHTRDKTNDLFKFQDIILQDTTWPLGLNSSSRRRHHYDSAFALATSS